MAGINYARAAIVAPPLLVGALLAGGCPSPTEVLNPTFLNAVGLGERVASLPGEAPAIVLEVENGTDRVVEFRVTWRDAEQNIHEQTGSLAPGQKYAEALFCPVEELTLGDVSNLDATGVVVRLGDGSGIAAYAGGPLIEVEPFGVLLQEGINYECGDNVTFRILPSQVTLSQYQTFAFIRRSGAQTQTQSP